MVADGEGAPDDRLTTRRDDWVDSYATRSAVLVASQVRSLFAVASRPEVVSLAGGMPFVSALPLQAMAETAASVIRDQGAVALQYGSGQGDPGLREQCVEVMALSGIRAGADEVVITAGSQSGLDLLIRVFCNPGDVVLVEAPTYITALAVMSSYECDVVHVAMDDGGLVPGALTEALEDLARQGRRAKLLYTIPSFHNPAGVTQDPVRRMEILAIAQQHKVLVLEDDPYGLLGFDGFVPRPLRAEDADGVIYLSTFSKTVAPGLRVGWVLAPPGVRDRLILANESAILCPSTLAQLVLREYLTHQPWLDQIAAFRVLYQERRDALLRAMEAQLPGTWTVPGGGFYSWVRLPDGVDAEAMLPRAVAALVAYVPGVGFYADGQGRSHLRLSYCYPEPDRITEGVRRLAQVVRNEMELRDTFGPAADASARLRAPARDLR